MAQNIKKSLNKTSKKKMYVENIKILNHRLCNILGFSESSVNRFKKADRNTVKKRWDTMKEVIIVTGRNRIDEEIGLYRKEKAVIEEVSVEVYNNIYSQFLESDKYYKVLFDLLKRSKGYNVKNRNSILANGDKMIKHLKGVINKLEAIRIELQKI